MTTSRNLLDRVHPFFKIVAFVSASFGGFIALMALSFLIVWAVISLPFGWALLVATLGVLGIILLVSALCYTLTS